jgi:hypothetical protein
MLIRTSSVSKAALVVVTLTVLCSCAMLCSRALAGLGCVKSVELEGGQTCNGMCNCTDAITCGNLIPTVVCADAPNNAATKRSVDAGNLAMSGSCGDSGDEEVCQLCSGTFNCAIENYWIGLDDFGNCSAFCGTHTDTQEDVCVGTIGS